MKPAALSIASPGLLMLWPSKLAVQPAALTVIVSEPLPSNAVAKFLDVTVEPD
jgi:hypothetical protein